MRPKTRYHVLRFVLALALAISVPIASRAWGAEKVVFGTDWQLLGQHIPYFVALDKGFYKERGLDVEILRGYGSADAVKRVAAKTVNFSFGDMGALVIARTKGIKVKMVAVVYGRPPYTVLTRAGLGIKSAKDLEGKTMGATAGSSTRKMFPVFAKLAGIDNSKVKWTTASSNVLWNLFMAKQVDGLPTFIVNKPKLSKTAEKSGIKINSLMYSDYGLSIYSNGILAREETIAQKPDLVRNFVHATVKGLDYSFKHPDESAAIFVRYRKEIKDAEVAKRQLLEVKNLALTPEAKQNGIGYMGREIVKKTRDIVSDVFKLKQEVALDDLYTNAFLK